MRASWNHKHQLHAVSGPGIDNMQGFSTCFMKRDSLKRFICYNFHCSKTFYDPGTYSRQGFSKFILIKRQTQKIYNFLWRYSIKISNEAVVIVIYDPFPVQGLTENDFLYFHQVNHKRFRILSWRDSLSKCFVAISMRSTLSGLGTERLVVFIEGPSEEIHCNYGQCLLTFLSGLGTGELVVL
jgi:hypothetical protein